MVDRSPVSYEPLHVLPISPGIALGPAHLLDRAESHQETSVHTHIQPDQLASERQRLQNALTAAETEIDELHRQVSCTVGRAEADIFTAHKLMLRDPDLLAEVGELMTQQLFSAETAWQMAVEQQSALLATLPDATLAARAADMRDIGARALNHLRVGVGEEPLVDPSRTRQAPALIVARYLTPSQTARLDPANILGICTVEGGPTTHAAILARALEIPAVAGVDARLLEEVREGQELAIDGGRGLVYLHLDETQRTQLNSALTEQQLKKSMRNTHRWRTRPGETADGWPIQIYANVGSLNDAREAAEQGAQGIGLLRTEILFGQCTTFPKEREQFESYLELFRAFADRSLFHKTIIARTLDVGADKPFPALEPLLGEWKEANPALGMRGIRLHLLHEELLRQQIRALLRAAGQTEISLQIMFPMITTLEETRRIKQVLAQTREELGQEGVPQPQNVPMGIMIETPAAVWLADALAREVDFFSIGANDLFQYTMAADRTNSQVMSLFGRLEPALWRSINHVLQAARLHKCPVAVCGEIAADVHYGPLLAGLGVEELSVSPPALVRIKEALYQHEMAYWQDKAQALLGAETVAEAEALVADIIL